MKKSVPYKAWLLESLRDHDEAVAYLNAALEESLKGDLESQSVFLMAIRDVAEAQGGISQLASSANLGRESLYKSLSKQGNPKWQTLVALLSGLGLQLKLV